MKRTLLLVMLSLACGAVVAAQTHKGHTSATAAGDASANAANSQGELAAGTRVAAQLQQTLDARKAHVGDQVVLKTTEAIKQHGRTLVQKGARLVGHVTEVQQRAARNGESRIGLLFDRLESGALSTPISATITSITQASAQTSVLDDETLIDSSASGTATARGNAGTSSGGGLLGGVGNTLGGVVGGATNTVGGVANTTTEAAGQVVSGTTTAVGNTASGVGRTVRGLRISQATSASVAGGSTLSLTGSNLHLEKNTTFNLTLNESVNVGRAN